MFYLVILILDGLNGGLKLVGNVKLVRVEQQDDSVRSFSKPPGHNKMILSAR